MNPLFFIYFGKKKAPNGAAKFISYVENEKEYWADCGIDLKILSLDSDDVSTIGAEPSSFLKKIKQYIVDHKKKSLFLSLLYFWRIYIRNANVVLRKVEEIAPTDTWLILNDIFVGYYVTKRIRNNRLMLILHNDGDPLKMVLSELPIFKRRFIKKMLDKEMDRIFSSCDKIILLSDKAKEVFMSTYPKQDKDKLVAICNGAPLYNSSIPTPLKYKEKKLILVMVGTVSIRKGYDLLISALKELKDEYKKKLQINVLGKIEDTEIIDYYNGANISNVLFFKGALNEEQVIDELQNAHVMLACSRDEGLPISIIEGMRAGLPIFSTSVGSIPILIEEEKNGMLFNPDPIEILDNLQDLLDGKYDLFQMGLRSSQKFHDDYSIYKMIDNYRALL